MTDKMRERKKTYIRNSMEYLCSPVFCLTNQELVADICFELGIKVAPKESEAEFRIYNTFDEQMVLRLTGTKDTHYPLSDILIEEAFFHYTQWTPLSILEEIFENEARNRYIRLSNELDRVKKSYGLDKF